jgi:hypothetical protein
MELSLFLKKIIFQILSGIGYNIPMDILNNLDNEYPLFETESSSGDIKIFSETCCNGCTCKSESDHKPE